MGLGTDHIWYVTPVPSKGGKTMDKNDDFVIFYGQRNYRPIDKGDVMIARAALFAVKFTIGLIIAFAIFLCAIFAWLF